MHFEARFGQFDGLTPIAAHRGPGAVLIAGRTSPACLIHPARKGVNIDFVFNAIQNDLFFYGSFGIAGSHLSIFETRANDAVFLKSCLAYPNGELGNERANRNRTRNRKADARLKFALSANIRQH